MAAAALVIGACGILEPEISDSGVIKKVEIEGGCWLIDTGEIEYLPFGLPQDMFVEGLHVNFEAQSRPEAATFCPGVPVQLIWIEAVPAGGEGGG